MPYTKGFSGLYTLALLQPWIKLTPNYKLQNNTKLHYFYLLINYKKNIIKIKIENFTRKLVYGYNVTQLAIISTEQTPQTQIIASIQISFKSVYVAICQVQRHRVRCIECATFLSLKCVLQEKISHPFSKKKL